VKGAVVAPSRKAWSTGTTGDVPPGANALLAWK
jgi:hypothetical protein